MEIEMDIVRLPSGQQAPPDADCISIFPAPQGGFQLNGTVLLSCGDTDETESVSLIGGPTYETREQAEDAGLAWAAEHCVARIHLGDVPFSAD